VRLVLLKAVLQLYAVRNRAAVETPVCLKDLLNLRSLCWRRLRYG
jgi:hypothetical protein